jgi:group I intron endonuclease
MKVSGIYKITNPNGRIYIGQAQNIHKRFLQYKNISNNIKRQVKLYNSLKKHGSDNHLFEILEECSFEKLNKRERYWQDYYDATSINNLNCILTGYDEVKSKMSDESRLKISKAKKNQIISKQHREKLSKAKKGIKLSKEHKEKISKNNIGKHNKPILQYNLEGNFIKEWECGYDAVKFLGISSNGNIVKCCKNIIPSAYGFIWRYKINENYALKISTEKPKVILDKILVQFDEDLNKIAEFTSLKDASLKTNISRTAISNNIAGLSKLAGGYIWKYIKLNN